MEKSDNSKINFYLLHKQHLLPGSKADDIVRVADDLNGLHATCATTPYLSLFARMNRFLKSDLKQEIETVKSLIRTRSIRSTIHILPVTKCSMIFTAVKSQLNKRSEKYLQHLGMTLDEFNSSAEKIIIGLTGKGLTANEIKKETSIFKNASHVLNILCDEGSMVRGAIRGGWKSNMHRYYRFKDFFENLEIENLPVEEAVETLVMSYIKTYGPVTLEDVIWWSGLNRNVVKDIFQKNGMKIQEINFLDGPGTGLMLKEDYKAFKRFIPSKDIFVNYLPALDPFIMGYKNRDRLIDKSYIDYVIDRFGNSAPTIILNGQIIGIWDMDENKKRVKFFLFKNMEDWVYEKIIETGLNIGLFYCESETDILEVRSVTPVKNLVVGSFMSPLKEF